MSWAQCSECEEIFTSDWGFTQHQRDKTQSPYDWRCATPEELQAEGWRKDTRNRWRDSRRPIPDLTQRSISVRDGVLGTLTPEKGEK